MVICLLLVQLLLCLIILYKEVLQERFRNFASSTFFLVYIIVYVVEPLILHVFYGGATSIVIGTPWHFSDEYVYYLFNCYGIALLSTYLLFGRVPATRKSDDRERRLSANSLQRRHDSSYVAILILAGFLLFVYSTGMSPVDLFYSSRFEWFDARSFSLLWLTVSSYFIALAGVYAYFVKTDPKHSRWLLVLCVASVLLHGLITKDRKWVILLASGWLAGSYEVSGRTLVINKRAVVVLLAVFAALVVSQFLRDVLFRYLIGEHIVLADEVTRWSSFLIEFGDISYFYRASLEAIQQNTHNGFLVPFAMVRRVLFVFLPAGYSGGLKVEDISATFSDVVNGGDVLRRGNMPPGLFGLFVISFGWLASLFIIPWLAILLRKLNSMFRNGHGSVRNVVMSLYIFAVVLSFRGDDSSAIYYMISTGMFLGVVHVMRLRSRSQKGKHEGSSERAFGT